MKQRDDWHLTDVVSHQQGRGDPFAAAMRATRMPMVISNPRLPDNPIVFANESFQALTGYGRDEVIGRNCRFLQGAGTDPDTVARIRQLLAAGEAVGVDILNYRKDGSTFWNALIISPVRGEDGTIHYHVASQVDVTDRIDAQRRSSEQQARVEAQVRARTADLEAALEAKTTLLHEVDHRVKNNLMMIGSLLRLQSRALPDARLRDTLENMLQRVDALATVHRRLYQAPDIQKFDIGDLAEALVRDLVGASGRSDIAVEITAQSVEIGPRRAAPVGLILNEVITNALKHAFADGRPGMLMLQVGVTDGLVTIEVGDDGPGFDTSATPSGSIGRLLVDRLARQAKATIGWTGRQPGTLFRVTFPVEG